MDDGSHTDWQALAAGCVPLYDGAPNVKALLPPHSFIDRADFTGADSDCPRTGQACGQPSAPRVSMTARLSEAAIMRLGGFVLLSACRRSGVDIPRPREL